MWRQWWCWWWEKRIKTQIMGWAVKVQSKRLRQQGYPGRLCNAPGMWEDHRHWGKEHTTTHARHTRRQISVAGFLFHARRLGRQQLNGVGGREGSVPALPLLTNPPPHGEKRRGSCRLMRITHAYIYTLTHPERQACTQQTTGTQAHTPHRHVNAINKTHRPPPGTIKNLRNQNLKNIRQPWCEVPVSSNFFLSYINLSQEIIIILFCTSFRAKMM